MEDAEGAVVAAGVAPDSDRGRAVGVVFCVVVEELGDLRRSVGEGGHGANRVPASLTAPSEKEVAGLNGVVDVWSV